MLSSPKNLKPVYNTEPVYNRLVQQFVRDRHLTLNQKCRDVAYQTYGHEAPVDNNDTANTEHCVVFNADVERLNEIRWEHLAGRKLWNPFKHLEFLLVLPLELVAWSFARLNNELRDPTITFFIFLGINLVVNITTGLLRRILAPARYIIRPSIETAKNYPITFAILLGLTLLIGLSPILALQFGLPLTGIFGFFFGAGYAPILMASLIFGFKAALTMTFTLINAPVAAMMLASIAAWTFLLKCANTVWDIVNGIRAILIKPKDNDQLGRVCELNNRKKYPLYYMSTNQRPDLDTLESKYPDTVPILIVNKRVKQAWVYGLTRERKGQLTPFNLSDELLKNELLNLVDFYKAKKIAREQEIDKLKNSINSEKKQEAKPEQAEILALKQASDNENEINQFQAEINRINTFIALDQSQPNNIPFLNNQFYIEIRRLHLHFPVGKGSTTAIAQTLHAMDPVHTEIKPVKKQEQVTGYRLALFTGTESIFFPARPQEQKAPEMKSGSSENFEAASHNKHKRTC